MSAPLPLAQIELTDRHRVGGKALQLARLARRGLPVPDGFAIPVEVFAEALTHAGLDALAQEAHEHPSESNFAAMREAVRGLTLTPTQRRLFTQAASRLSGRLAVRSSAIDEDGAHRSFAGQHLTELGVSPSQVPDAILACWASLYSANALAYRRGDARGPRPGAMGVVVQELVDSRVSGVMFTVNPLNGSWREMIVESTWGLCEGLVSGRVAPHWSLVRRPRRAPRPVQRVLSRVRLQVMQQDLPPIDRRWVVRGGELVEEPVPDSLVRAETLTRRELLRLCRLGLKVESMLGSPQDIEWSYDATGKLFLLQARPITATAQARPREDVLWTRRFIGERWPEPATPLGWSLMAPVFEHFIAYPETQNKLLGGGPALRLIDGRPYLNTTIFRHLAFKLPGAPAPRFMTELVPPEEEATWQRRFAMLPDVSVYTSVLRETLTERRWRRFAFNPLTNHLVWDAFEARLGEELTRLGRRPVSRRDALRRMEAQLATVREYVGIHIVSLLFANLFFQLLEGSLATWAPEGAGSLLTRLAVCPPGNLTLATNEALHTLAAKASDADLDALAAGEPVSDAFGAALDHFLAEYGHRASASWEVFTPRWRDHAELLVPLLKSAHAGADPSERAERQEAAFAEASAELSARLAAPQRVIVGLLTHYTRRYLLLRENQRFAFDHLLLTLQDTAYWLGDRFVDDGILDRREQVAMLTWEELSALVHGELEAAEVREWILRREAQHHEQAHSAPPVFLRGDDGVASPLVGNRLQGLGISPGRASGPVRILRHLADAERLQPGEILVAPAVDPAWTPLFLKASGVLLEMGSRLSHGAVVAREYQVPAVVNLDGITHRLRDGQHVTVDGTRGAVWLHDDV
ncbi:MAG: hypothetical protein EP330_26560 [Deltaproteobacteria bacterium]|nr:MAG: hypothetical protein EP330_26560 [Deltaproteobacteria bacterium]